MTQAEERQQAAEIDVEGRQERPAHLLNGAAERNPEIGLVMAQRLDKPAKKTRSDKGTKRPAKPEPTPAPAQGAFTEQDKERILELHAAILQAYEEQRAASVRLEQAEAELIAYLAARTSK